MARAKSKGFQSLAEKLPSVLRQFGLKDKIMVYRAVAEWESIAGTGIARHSTALAVEDKTLVVAVDSPAWMTQLFYLKGQLLENISRHIGSGLVTDVRFVLKREPFST
jgi:predicted nucleic acid-binding Zn ribbon protein